MTSVTRARALRGLLTAAFVTAACGREPRVTLGSEALASVNGDGGALRVEPSVVRRGDTVVVAWNDSHGGVLGSGTGTMVAWAYSTDGGATFGFGGYLPALGAPPDAADSWLATGPDGAFYLQLLHWGEPQEILVYRMAPGAFGVWQAPVRATAATMVDKPALWAGPDARLTITFTGRDSVGFVVAMVESADGGATWTAPRVLSGPGVRQRIRAGSGVARCGDRMVVAWLEGQFPGDPADVWVTESVAGDARFGSPHRLLTLDQPLRAPPGYHMGGYPAFPAAMPNNAWVACRGDAFYLTVAEGRDDGSRVVLVTGTAGPAGVAWDTPATVSEADSGWAVLPAVAATPRGPAVLYLGSEGSAPRFRPVLAWLDRGGAWRDTALAGVTDWREVPGDSVYAPIQRNLGDYVTLTGLESDLVAAWTAAGGGGSVIHVRTVRIR